MATKKQAAKKPSGASAKKQTAPSTKKTPKRAKPRTVPGTLLRGADGELYFIPDAGLAPFRVFDSEKPRAEKLLAEKGTEGQTDVRPQSNLDTLHTTIQVSHPPAEAGMMKPIVICTFLEENH